jgi:DNA-binding CsgD family transcriptional regulator
MGRLKRATYHAGRAAANGDDPAGMTQAEAIALRMMAAGQRLAQARAHAAAERQKRLAVRLFSWQEDEA